MFRYALICALFVLSTAQFRRQSHFGSRTGFTRTTPSRTPQVQVQTFQARPRETYQIIPILRFDQQGPEGGAYSFNLETGDGLVRSERGNQGPSGGANKEGSWSFTLPDGTPAQFSFVANENGYQVDSNLLPQAPPMPAHALEQIAKAERERAAGIIHDGSWDPIRYGSGSSSSNVQTVRRQSFRSRNRAFGK